MKASEHRETAKAHRRRELELVIRWYTNIGETSAKCYFNTNPFGNTTGVFKVGINAYETTESFEELLIEFRTELEADGYTINRGTDMKLFRSGRYIELDWSKE